MKRLKVGMQVMVCEGSGLDSRRIGTVIEKHRVPLDGRGVPKITGHYKPMYPDEVALIDDQGRMFTMFRHRLMVQ